MYHAVLPFVFIRQILDQQLLAVCTLPESYEETGVMLEKRRAVNIAGRRDVCGAISISLLPCNAKDDLRVCDER